jgi:hypothetical protein
METGSKTRGFLLVKKIKDLGYCYTILKDEGV